jgi:hypothetical protein
MARVGETIEHPRTSERFAFIGTVATAGGESQWKELR